MVYALSAQATMISAMLASEAQVRMREHCRLVGKVARTAS